MLSKQNNILQTNPRLVIREGESVYKFLSHDELLDERRRNSTAELFINNFVDRLSQVHKLELNIVKYEFYSNYTVSDYIDATPLAGIDVHFWIQNYLTIACFFEEELPPENKYLIGDFSITNVFLLGHRKFAYIDQGKDYLKEGQQGESIARIVQHLLENNVKWSSIKVYLSDDFNFMSMEKAIKRRAKYVFWKRLAPGSILSAAYRYLIYLRNFYA